MTIRNLATLDRNICQPLGRIIQEAFADGFIGTGSINMAHTLIASEAGSSWDGIHKFKTTVNIAMESLIVAAQMKLEFGADAIITLPGYTNSILQLFLSGSAKPNLDGGDISCLDFEYHIDETNGAPRIAVPMHFAAEEPGANFDALFNTQNFGDIGDEASSGTPTWGTEHRIIPVMIANTVYYLHATVD